MTFLVIININNNVQIRLVKRRNNVIYYTKYRVFCPVLGAKHQNIIKNNRKDGIEMKKILAIVLLLILAVGVFAACNQVQPTEKKVRWDTNETWTYNISLADFSTSLTTTEGTFYKNFLYSGETNPLSGELDRVVPDALQGTYVVNVRVDVSAGVTSVYSEQTMFATYPAASLDLDALADRVENQNGDLVTLKSVVKTTVVFKNGTAQTPVSSHIKEKGFYVGKQYQTVSDYELKTEYKVGSKKTEIKVTNEKDEVVYDQSVKAASIIDSAQVLLFARSFDKTSTSFQDNQRVMVFDPTTKTTRTMSFVYTEKQNVLVDHLFSGDAESTQVATSLNRLDVLLDGMAFMTQTNLPDLTAKGWDKISAGEVFNTYYPKHTIYSFRVGFATFTLQNCLSDAIVGEIQVKAA